MTRGPSPRYSPAPVNGKRLLAWMTSFFVIALSTSFARATTPALDRVHAAGVLRWGGDIQGGEPYVYDDPDNPGRLVGFEVDIADALARELGVRSEFVQNDWANLVP